MIYLKKTLYSKSEVDYGKSSSPAEHRCGICTHRCHNSCDIVEGRIELMDGCKMFDVDLLEAANDPINLSNHPPTKK